jgi:hypothetical protein
MKKIYLILSVLFISFGCGEDFTTINPKGVLSDATMQNAGGVNLLLTSTYSALDGIYQGAGDPWFSTGDNWWFDVLSDDAHKGSEDSDQAPLFDLETYNWTTANGYPLGKWRSLYAGANRANAVINVAAPIADTDADVAQALAEAKFLRGFFYFELQKIWGNVAYVDETQYASNEFNQPNTGDVWDQIEADFTYAAANLASSSSEPGRANSWTAKAFLGKTHIYQGEYAEASTQLEAVISSGVYVLNSEYVDNFNSAGENSKESVFAIQFAADGGLSNNGNRGGTLNFQIGSDLGGFCCGFYQPSVDLASAFKTESGLPMLDDYHATPITNDYGLAVEDAFTPHTGDLDPRIDYTMGRRGIMYNGFMAMAGASWVRAGAVDISGPFISSKNHYRADEDDNRGSGGWGEQRTGINYNVMRYADVLLMAAECDVEAGRLEAARTKVNLIRTRAAGSTVADAAVTNYNIATYATVWPDAAVARQAVRCERRLELAMEGHRFFDLKRWDVLATTLNAYVTNEAKTITNFGEKANTFQSHMTDMFIPLNAIDLSTGILIQNPGY